MSADRGDDVAEEPTVILSPRMFDDDELVASRYQIVRFVASGGMGEVYEAHDRDLNERVAIKTVRAFGSGNDAIERLRREIQLARRVTHPNVCRIFDIARHQTRHGVVTFVTMELLRGVTLARHLRERGRLPTNEALPVARQICDGLAAAHRAGVVHRDLKSDNIMLVPDGDAVRAVITDFGLARLTAPENDMADITRPGDMIGTAAYLAPEQCEGQEATAASDIYALGVVLYEMITGRRPFPGASLVTTVIRKLREPVLSPRTHVPDLDPRWEAAILRCLDRNPEARFQDAREVVAGLTGPAPQPHRSRRILFAGGVLFLLAVVAAVLQWRTTRTVTPAPPELRQSFAARPAVAVFQLRNASGRADAAWLSTALAEMLSTELAAEGRLRAIPGEDVQRARIEQTLEQTASFSGDTLRRIRNNLGADFVVSGSYVALPNDEIRVDIRLQDATGRRPDMALAETGSTSRLFDLVSRAGSKMRGATGVSAVSLASSTQALGAIPADPRVARLYAEGIERLRNFDALSARQLLERAAARDPKQPLVHAALASAATALGYDREARAAARHAFELSSNLPREQRLLIEAGYRESVGEWEKAVEIYRLLASFFSDNLEYGIRLAAAQTRKGDPHEALETLEVLRRLPEPLRSDPRIDLAEVDATNTLSDYARMEAAARRAVAKGEARGARLLVARALSATGVAMHRQGKTEEGLAAQRRALAIYREAGDRNGIARAFIRIGSVHIYRGQVGEAVPHFEAARRIGEETGDAWTKAAAYNNLAFCAFTRGQPQQAEKLLRAMLEVAHDIADRKIEATAHDNIGYALYLQGDLAGASDHFTRSVDLARAIRAQQVLAVATMNVGDVLLARGDVDGARMQYEAALSIRQKIGEKRAIAESQLSLARIAIEQQRGGEAAALASQAAAWGEASRTWDVEALARATLAHALVLERRLTEAERESAGAMRLAEKHENVLVKFAALLSAARVAAAQRRQPDAEELVQRSLALTRVGPLIAPRLDAELLRAEVAAAGEQRRLRAQLAREAASRGFMLVAKKAR